MYIDSLSIQNIKTFESPDVIDFLHPDRQWKNAEHDGLCPKPRLPNVNLLLGDNGCGKSTLLQAIALTAFGPAVSDAKLSVPNMVRRATTPLEDRAAYTNAGLLLHEQDGWNDLTIESRITYFRRGDLEKVDFDGEVQNEIWEPVFQSENLSFFAVGYGSTRRVEAAENFDLGARTKKTFIRGQRVGSLLEDSFSLIPLKYWLPELKRSNPARHEEVIDLINLMIGPGKFKFTGKVEKRSSDYLFERGGLQIPFRSLSDGYRSFVGWVSDLLFHLDFGSPEHASLADCQGIVLVDEIDLHLHPKWQMQVIPTVAKAMPRMQFVFTSHSPLVAGSLEWMNIITLKTAPKSNRTIARRLDQSIHGLDADQILLTDFFGLTTTRAASKNRQLNQLTKRARGGDDEAAKELIAQLARGTEGNGDSLPDHGE